MNNKEYLKAELKICFELIDTILECHYAGKKNMYRLLAGQLRILLCHKNRGNMLLPRVFPEIVLSSLKTIDWSDEKNEEIMMHDPNGDARISRMPFEIIRYSNGLVVADLFFNKDEMLDTKSWINQALTYNPTPLTINDIIIHIAEKGGGAHVDNSPSPQLRYMRQRTPTGQTYAEMFIIALARTVQLIGEELFNYEAPKVPFELRNDKHERYNSLVVAHKEKANALSNFPKDRTKK